MFFIIFIVAVTVSGILFIIIPRRVRFFIIFIVAAVTVVNSASID